jgi:RNA recognition motif-containing protein
MQILVVNIPADFTEEDLRSMFEPFGTVRTVMVGTNKKAEAPEGYGIVEMPVKHEARASVEALKGKELKGKQLRVRILRPDDPFHNAMQPSGRMSGGGGQIQKKGFYRGIGVMRRGGQRGS